MQHVNKTVLSVIAILVLLLGGWAIYRFMKPVNKEESTYVFQCKDAKSITATFYNGDASRVDLALSDGRTFSLPQAISASGARYADDAISTIFWNKGDSAFLEEKGVQTFMDCTTNGVATTTPVTTVKPVTPTPSTGGGTTAPQFTETYTNATYKFTLNYPRELQTEPFASFHNLSNTSWRVLGTSEKRGTAVVSIPVFRVDQGSVSTGKKYPLWYAAEVRVGTSKDIAQCYAKDTGYTNQVVTDVTINGVAFKKFAFADAGMMQYLNGFSYRTIKGDTCYVIEQVQTGSSYKDATMVNGYTEAELAAYFNKAGAIVQTFKFTK